MISCGYCAKFLRTAFIIIIIIIIIIMIVVISFFIVDVKIVTVPIN